MSIRLLHRTQMVDRIAYWRQSQPAIPAGLILPYWGQYVPSGWSRIDSDFGSWVFPRLRTESEGDPLDVEYDLQNTVAQCSTQGGHLTGSTQNYEAADGGAGNNDDNTPHNHGGTLAGALYFPDRINCSIAEADSDLDDLPANMHFLTYDTRDLASYGWARRVSELSNPALWWGRTETYGTPGFSSKYNTVAYTIPADGAHDHGGGRGGTNGGSNTARRDLVYHPNHDHGGSISLAVTHNIKAAIFNWWYSDASKSIRETPGIIGLWRGSLASIPAGWKTVDDLAYFYPAVSQTISQGGTLQNGDNLISSAGGVAANDDLHQHWDETNSNRDRNDGQHEPFLGQHGHNITFADQTWFSRRISWYVLKRLW